jgi:hypothetical protein
MLDGPRRREKASVKRGHVLILVHDFLALFDSLLRLTGKIF